MMADKREMMVSWTSGAVQKTSESGYFSKRELRGLLKNWGGSVNEREESGMTPVWGLNNSMD